MEGIEELKASVRERLLQYDDGSFENKAKEIAQVTIDQSQRAELLTDWVLKNVIRFHAEKPKLDYLKNNPLRFSSVVPKKKRDIRKFTKEQHVVVSTLPLHDHRGGSPELSHEEVSRKKTNKIPKVNGTKRSLLSEGEEMGRRGKKQRNSLAPEIKERIEGLRGTDLNLVITKKLHPTDLTQQNNRLSIPNNQKECDFLTEEEEHILNLKVGKENMGINVRVISPTGAIADDIVLKKWKFKKEGSFAYNLISGWTRFAANADLKENDIVQLWSFRVEGEIWFQLVKSGSEIEESGQSGNQHQGKDNGVSTNGDGREEDNNNNGPSSSCVDGIADNARYINGGGSIRDDAINMRTSNVLMVA